MSEHPHLGNAPIREALIDFRVRLPSDSSPETLLALTEELRAEFPKVGPIQQFQGEIQFSGEGPVSVQKGPQLLGYRLESTDGLNIAQIRIDGLTFSRLEPYESWDRMVEDTWVVWERYLARSIPLGIERIATRFINRIGLPPSGHLAEVFSVPPVVPDGRIDARAASMVLPGPRLPHWSTDRGTSREAHTVWMAILAVERSAWDTEQSHVRRQRDLALAEAFHECSQPDWDGYGAVPANELSTAWARKVLSAFPDCLGVPDIAFEPDGDAGLEWWRGPDRVLSVSVGRNGELRYAARLNAARATRFLGLRPGNGAPSA